MMPGTAVKFDRLVALGRERYGWTPVVSGPDDAYRTRPRQQHYWDTLPYPQAARPGSSSHGGDYQGRESGALDIGNWGEIGQRAFYQLAWDAGFEPGFFDWEPWHIIDWSPWSVPHAPTPIDESEEDEMKLLYVTDSVDGNGVPGWALLNTRTGKLLTLRNTVAGAQDNANSWARVWGDAKTVTRQDMLNAVDGIQKTT